jgi:hypothetical protein
MTYNITNYNGTALTTIADGTIDTTHTSLALPGRNYSGFGQYVDENFVYLVENFAGTTPPHNPLTGQLWYNTNNSTLYVCPAAGTTDPAAWLSLASTSSAGNTTFGNITVTGNTQTANINVTAAVTASSATVSTLTVSANATVANLAATAANLTTLTTANITSGAQSTPGTLTGVWTANGSGTANSIAGTAMWITGGNLVVGGTGSALGVKSDNYYYANGAPISFAGNYSDANVAAYLPTYTGNVGQVNGGAKFNGNVLSTGANSTAGTITGTWTLTTGSRLNATYADLAERFAADDIYDAGTVVSLGGAHEITAVQYELSEDVFGVISQSAAYLMNAGAGSDNTHPAVAVSGRVPVKVTGKVRKGDRLVSAGSGIARAARVGEATSFNVIGRSLEDKADDAIGYVEAFVSIK